MFHLIILDIYSNKYFFFVKQSRGLDVGNGKQETQMLIHSSL